MKVLIAGCGDLGMRVAALLCEAGHEVIGLGRTSRALSINPSSAPSTPISTSAPTHPCQAANQFCWYTGDLIDPLTLSALPTDITHVIFAASPDQRQEQAYRNLFIHGMQHLIAALNPSSLKRFMFVSSSAVYGEHGDEWVDEQTPTDPKGFNGRVLVEAEQWLLSQPVESVILRLSGIYGPGRDQLLARIKEGLATVPRQQPHWSNRIHIEDAARAVFHLLVLPAPESIYLVTDGHPYPMDVLYDRLADMLGATPPPEGQAPAMLGSKKLSNARLLSTGFTCCWPDALVGYANLIDQASG